VWIAIKRKKDLSKFLYHKKDHLAHFSKKNGLWCATPFCLKFCVSRPPLERNCRFWTEIARCVSAITPSKKVQFTLSNELKLISPKGGSKTQNDHFRCKIVLCLKKVCYRVSLFENFWRHCCKAFIGLTICAKMIYGATPSTWNFGSNWPRWGEVADFRSVFARSTSAVTRNEKVQLTLIALIGSPLRGFEGAKDERCTVTLSLSPQRGLKYTR